LRRSEGEVKEVSRGLPGSLRDELPVFLPECWIEARGSFRRREEKGKLSFLKGKTTFFPSRPGLRRLYRRSSFPKTGIEKSRVL